MPPPENPFYAEPTLLPEPALRGFSKTRFGLRVGNRRKWQNVHHEYSHPAYRLTERAAPRPPGLLAYAVTRSGRAREVEAEVRDANDTSEASASQMTASFVSLLEPPQLLLALSGY